ncbi:MAG: RIP metalloprotease RseP [Wenzhouxiangellaceae bacterium]|nr:RIP metalloprotease RseP [Wenzhouxiangellaceae bacterium]
MEFLGSVFWLVVALGLLVTFHEFGHYWVARRAGVKVLRFSVGFGRPLWRRRADNGVEFVIAAIPLGGYVKMLDEREAPVDDPAERAQAFNNQSLSARAAIVVAGPLFNLIFAVAAFWLMFMVGVPETRPVLGPTEGLAAEAGLREGDRLVAVDGRSVDSWTHAVLALIPPALDRRAVAVRAETEFGGTREAMLALDRLGNEFREERVLEALGLSPWRPDLPAVIGRVAPDTPAERAGLRSGDRVIAIDERSIASWNDLVQAIPEAAGDGRLTVAIERDGTAQSVVIRPEPIDGRPVIGVSPVEPGEELRAQMERAFTVVRHGPVTAMTEAVGETWRLTGATLGMLGRMVTGSASLSNLSGPITIAQMAQDSARLGVSRFLFFLGLISLSLAIINLLPIPILDGGHLVYLLIEWVKGSPLSDRGLAIGQSLGLVMVLTLMSIALFNDFLRLAQ